ncbi:hypothetical protein DAEQUDRAFT_808877 [Daedalea quercina L-15889]|uniref:Cleavage stimulation factor subunit 2 hinge domain-containing protein n=1 Tax=Daedalea quercina L-15889 TaxID=1314783 RepID=A0A165T4B9_9APHY|nr:hypothetical protein DAEQUDRAFT_808877 [Daedalea quercina L-15889]
MSAQSLQEDQLLELLLQLKKTTPEEARTILNSQPQIAYALMAVLVNVNAVNAEVVQKIIGAYTAQTGVVSTSQSHPTPVPGPPAPPMPAIPPHLAQPPPRGGTPTYPTQPRGGTPTYPAQQSPGFPPSYSTPPPQPVYGGPQAAGQIPGLGAYPSQPAPAPSPPAPKPAQSAASILAAALQKVPDEQKPLVMQIISMTREEIFAMPPTERDSIITLRATLGLTT